MTVYMGQSTRQPARGLQGSISGCRCSMTGSSSSASRCCSSTRTHSSSVARCRVRLLLKLRSLLLIKPGLACHLHFVEWLACTDSTAQQTATYNLVILQTCAFCTLHQEAGCCMFDIIAAAASMPLRATTCNQIAGRPLNEWKMQSI